MYEPEITIITPTHNIVDTGKADDFTLLLNLLNRQTYPYVEHIIIDNASTDETTTLLKDYKNLGYIEFFSAPDNGKFDAMNKGLLRAKGKYVAFLSCDDFYHDIMGLEYVVNYMEEEKADFCYFPAYCVQPDNSAFLYNPSPHNVFQVMPFSRQAAIFNKESLAKIGNFDSKFRLFADYDLMIKLFLHRFKGIFFESCIVTYKMGENSLKHPTQIQAECSHIFHQNYRALYPMTDNVVDRMVNIAEIPKPLLDKFAKCFPEEEQEIFYERYEQMFEFRKQNAQAMREQKRQQRGQ